MTTGGAAALASTKLAAPQLPERFVERPNLAEPLRHAIDEAGIRMVLVSAPAGAGKTTLLATLAWTAGPPVAWLHLDPADDDPVRFWGAVVASIERVRPGVADAVSSVVRSTRGHGDSVVAALVNSLVGDPDGLVLVLDDYQVIEDDDIHRAMDLLIERLPPGVTIAVATRVDPPLRLGRLRVRDQVHEVRNAQLRMDPEAARSLLGWGRDDDTAPVGDDDVATLCERTEGWAAGLVLAGLSMRRSQDPHAFVRDFGGDDRLVVDYLGDELFDGIDDDERERLLVTCVVDRLCGDLVDHLCGGGGGTRWLAELAATNQLLLALDQTGTWYRHHQLVLELLRSEALATIGERLPGLHRLAAEWFSGHEEPELAVHHWIAAGEPLHAAQVLGGGLGWWMIAGGEQATLRRILDRLGPATGQQMGAALQMGWCSLIANDIDAASSWLSTAQGLRSADPDDDALFESLEIFIELGRGDVGVAAAIAGRALDSGRLPDQFSPMSTTAGAALALAGRLDEARRALDIAERRARHDGAAANEMMAPMYLALVEAEVGRRSAAQAAAGRAIAVAEARGLDRYPRTAVAYAVRAATDPDPASAEADIAHASALIAAPANVLDEAYVVTVAADLAIASGRSGGEELLDRATDLLAACHDPGVVGSCLARVRARHGLVRSPARPAALVEQLTDRELAVLHQLPSRLSQREIADELYVSLNTVKTHCRAIFRKLEVGDRQAAVQRARELGLLA